MSVETISLDNNIGIIHTWKNEVSGSDVLHVLKELFSKNVFKEYKYWVTDFTGITKFPISQDEINQVVSLDKQAEKVNPNIIIVVIASEDLHFGLSRMWQIMADEICWDKIVVRSLDEADKQLINRMKEKFNINITSALTGC